MRSLHVGRDDKMRSLHALRLVEMTRGGRDDKWPSVISSGVEKSLARPCPRKLMRSLHALRLVEMTRKKGA